MTPNLGPAASLAIALDTGDADLALSWASSVQGIFGVAKVGLELFCAQGPDMVRKIMDMGFEVFLDLKLYDIPTTVERSASVIGALGVSYMTVHAAGGAKMIEAALAGLHTGSESAGRVSPQLLGVTVLTSVGEVSEAEIRDRISILKEAGADGLVCAPPDLPIANSLAPEFLKVVPGIRRRSDDRGDQARVSTPDIAISAGADILVIGRPVTASEDIRSAALEMRDLVANVQK